VWRRKKSQIRRSLSDEGGETKCFDGGVSGAILKSTKRKV